VVFVEASYNKGLDFGIDGGFKQTPGQNSFAGITTNLVVGPTGTNLITQYLPTRLTTVFGTNLFSGMAGLSGVAGGNGGIYSILGADYQATLHAIATAGRAEILSRPSILARNNQPATISLGQSVPIISGTTYDSLGNQHNSFTYQTVGISLVVTPFIFASGDTVEMQVTPTSSELAPQNEWVVTSTGPSGNVSSPVINQRTADTVVDVPNGQTVIIGGLMQKSTQKNQTKIPILGDIPLLGAAFRRTVNSDAKTELLIFLTPFVVKTATQLAELTDKERSKSELMPTGMSKQQLDRYLDGLPETGTGKKGRDSNGYLPAPPPSQMPEP
jgi:general secretion pathway protein D